MTARASLLLPFVALLSACPQSTTGSDAASPDDATTDAALDAAPDARPDITTDVAPDAAPDIARDVAPDFTMPACPSPASIAHGASCAGLTGLTCSGAAGCFQCGAFAFARYAPSCNCSSGQWWCARVDCGAMAGCGSFSDPMCAVPGPCDAGAPDSAVVDAPSDAPTDGGCSRPDVAVLPSRTSCEGGMTCPTGYECMSFSGVVLQLFCGRACRSDCDCPATQVCGSYSDKAGTHPLCVTR